MSGDKAKGSKKNRKYGRNSSRSLSMQRYRAEERQAKNKIRKVKKHLKNNENDKQAKQWIKAGFLPPCKYKKAA